MIAVLFILLPGASRLSLNRAVRNVGVLYWWEEGGDDDRPTRGIRRQKPWKRLPPLRASTRPRRAVKIIFIVSVFNDRLTGGRLK